MVTVEMGAAGSLSRAAWISRPGFIREPSNRPGNLRATGKDGVHMARRNRQTFKKREREMAKKQKKQDKAERIADRKANRTSEDDPEEVNPAPVDDADKPSTLRTVPIGRSAPAPGKR